MSASYCCFALTILGLSTSIFLSSAFFLFLGQLRNCDLWHTVISPYYMSRKIISSCTLFPLRSPCSILADQLADHGDLIFGEAIVIGFQLLQALNHLHTDDLPDSRRAALAVQLANLFSILENSLLQCLPNSRRTVAGR